MRPDSNERNARVCGASQGIGRATTPELAGLGANVTLLARSANTPAAELAADGITVIAFL